MPEGERCKKRSRKLRLRPEKLEFRPYERGKGTIFIRFHARLPHGRKQSERKRPLAAFLAGADGGCVANDIDRAETGIIKQQYGVLPFAGSLISFEDVVACNHVRVKA